jgi:fructan beta-fructosidase
MEPGSSETVGLKLRVGDDEETLVGYDSFSKTVFVDRTKSGEDDFHSEF